MSYEDYEDQNLYPQEWSEQDLINLIKKHSFNEISVKEISEEVYLDFEAEKQLQEEPNAKTSSCSLQVRLLHELGFFELPIFKGMTSGQIQYIVQRVLNRGSREVRGNINALKPTSKEDPIKYTTSLDSTIKKARKIINEIE